jgi:hypothetical protein
METTSAQYDKLLSEICQWLEGHRITRLRVLALWIYGLFRAEHCSLHKVAKHLPLKTNKASKIQRLKRFLKNPGIVVGKIYTKIVKVMLEKWNGKSLELVMDRTEWGVFNLLLCGIAHNKRVLPLGWRLLDHPGNSSFEEQKELLDSIRPLLPETCHVSLLGDGEFKSVELMEYALACGWDFHLGQSKSTWMKFPSGKWKQLKSLKVSDGMPCYHQGVFLTEEHEFGPVNVIAYWDREKERVRYVATSRRACRATLNWGKRRSWIEATFRDLKSGGFQLESSRITNPDRMNRLLLVMGVTYLWCYHAGRWVFKTGRRRQIDVGTKRNLSFFRMGLDWLNYAIQLPIQDFKIGLLAYSSQSDP